MDTSSTRVLQPPGGRSNGDFFGCKGSEQPVKAVKPQVAPVQTSTVGAPIVGRTSIRTHAPPGGLSTGDFFGAQQAPQARKQVKENVPAAPAPTQPVSHRKYPPGGFSSFSLG